MILAKWWLKLMLIYSSFYETITDTAMDTVHADGFIQPLIEFG